MSWYSPLNRSRQFLYLLLLLAVVWFAPSAVFGVQYQTRPGTLVREGPGNYYPLTVMLKQQAQVVKLDSSDGWLKVEISGDGSGWISANAVLPEQAQGAKPAEDIALASQVKIGVDRAAIGAMIKGLQVDMKVEGEVSTAYDEPPQVDKSSVTSFRGEFTGLDVEKPLSAVEMGRALMPEYLSLSPVLTAQQLTAWGGRRDAYEPYCNQVLLWVADRTGASNVIPRTFVAREGNNAYCFPGGWIVIGTDLLREIEDESELAGVLGHELAHAVFQHGEQALERESWRIGAADAFAELDAETGTEDDAEIADLEQFGNSVIQMVQRKHNIEIELIADSAATVWLARCGYDPEGLLRFLLRIRSKFGEGLVGHGQISLAWLTSRDELDQRIDRLLKQVASLRKKYGKKLEEGGKFKTRFKRNLG